jgi:hypothetical protein
MGESKTAHPPGFLGAEFNDFLFQLICADNRGRQVTVVSALARLDLDPWEEADRLSRLPGESAARSVCIALSRLPEIALGLAERQQIAMRLVQLLPKRFLGGQVTRHSSRAVTPITLRRAVAGLICGLAIFLASQAVWQSFHAQRAAPQLPAARPALIAPAAHPASTPMRPSQLGK